MTDRFPSVVALVPAKMTSQRLPGKNLALLNGVPLVLHSVRAGCASLRIDHVYVSTESTEIELAVRDEDCSLIRRPPELSEPAATNFHVLRHAVTSIVAETGSAPDLIVLLQPSHPFRRPGEIDEAVDLIAATPEASCLLTVAPINKPVGRIDKGRWEELTPLDRGADSRKPALHRNEGNLYIFRPDRTVAKGTYFGEHVIAHELARPELDIDIDYPWDLDYADFVCRMNPLAREYISPYREPGQTSAAANDNAEAGAR